MLLLVERSIKVSKVQLKICSLNKFLSGNSLLVLIRLCIHKGQITNPKLYYQKHVKTMSNLYKILKNVAKVLH